MMTRSQMSTQQRAQQDEVKHYEARKPGYYCLEAGPWGYVCTQAPGHDYSCHDGGRDASFNYHWPEDWSVPAGQHPFDCTCGEFKAHRP
jgi:hypothetical protein